MEQRRLDQIRVHNDLINAEIIETRRQLAIQQDIYNRNAGKIFGEGARLKKSSKAEIERLEALISSLMSSLK